jgi:hypothetical protein
MLTGVQLNEMSQVDITTVNPALLTNISAISINTALPQTERIEQYLRQVNNPYCFMSGNTPVRIRFAETEKPLSQSLVEYFCRLKNN